MIFDSIKNLPRYPGIPYAKEIERFIAAHDCGSLADGETEILGRNLFVRIAGYSTGPESEKKFEAHSIYADLQYVVTGAEIMHLSILSGARPVTAYDQTADIRFFEDVKEASPVLVPAGHFTLFFPGELHMPGCMAAGIPCRIKKLVFKIKV